MEIQVEYSQKIIFKDVPGPAKLKKYHVTPWHCQFSVPRRLSVPHTHTHARTHTHAHTHTPMSWTKAISRRQACSWLKKQ